LRYSAENLTIFGRRLASVAARVLRASRRAKPGSGDAPQGRSRHSSITPPVPIVQLTPWPGTDGNHSCGCGDCGAGDEDTPALLLAKLLVDDAALHAAGDRDDLAGDVA
jgi:hypothetical protein